MKTLLNVSILTLGAMLSFSAIAMNIDTGRTGTEIGGNPRTWTPCEAAYKGDEKAIAVCQQIRDAAVARWDAKHRRQNERANKVELL
jgi:hypothetical protein